MPKSSNPQKEKRKSMTGIVRQMDATGYLPHFARSPAGVHNTMHAYAVFMPGVRGRYKTMPVRRFGGSMHATAVEEWEYDAMRQETNAENASTLLLFDNETGIVRSVGLPAEAHAKDGMQALSLIHI